MREPRQQPGLMTLNAIQHQKGYAMPDIPDCIKGLVADDEQRQKDQQALAAYLAGKKRRQSPQEIADAAIRASRARRNRYSRQRRNRGL